MGVETKSLIYGRILIYNEQIDKHTKNERTDSL